MPEAQKHTVPEDVTPTRLSDYGHRVFFGFSRAGFQKAIKRGEIYVKGKEGKVFDATLSLDRHPLNAEWARYAMKRYPAETLKASIGIHWNAFRLWRKGAQFHDHPGYGTQTPDSAGIGATEMTTLNNVGTVTSWKT